ncbi:MAG TPA: PqiC family protein [Kofleriaceae bacterium]|nr:PqiC family protein [Kofleriaceae bacterium]
MKGHAFALAALLVGACRSAGSEYYTLIAPPAEHPAPVSEAFQLDVLPVDVPPEVDRAEIVVREGPGKLTPVDTRTWISPLPRELRHAFSDDLGRALGARDVAGASPVANIPTYRIKIVVQRFDSSLGARASIEAISTIRDAGGAAPPVVCSHRASEPAAAGYEKLAEAHQRAIAAIAGQIAATIRGLQAGKTGCAGEGDARLTGT